MEARVNRNPQGGAKATKKSPKRVDAVLPDNDTEVVDVLDQISTLGAERANPYKATLQINGKPVAMQIDTGASVSLISQETQKCLSPTAALAKPEIQLRTYTSDPITVVGQMSVEVKYKEYEGRHMLYIVEDNGPALVGRDWLCKIQLDWPS